MEAKAQRPLSAITAFHPDWPYLTAKDHEFLRAVLMLLISSLVCIEFGLMIRCGCPLLTELVADLH